MDDVSDLGYITGRKEYNSIFSMIKEQSIVGEYIHEQFLDNASNYQEKYTNYNKFFDMINKTLFEIDLLNIKNRKDNPLFTPSSLFKNKSLKILDIGSASGNSVFPIVDLCPNSIILATDLSIQLLHLLKEEAANRNINNIGLVQMNAEELNFREQSFDLVMGASILHHLFAPDKTIDNCSKVLKKGGFAIFYEPFEVGNVFIKVIFEELIHLSKGTDYPLSEEITKFFKLIINDYNHRLGRDKTQDYYRYMDDKWLFTKQYFIELAQKYKFSNVHIYSLREVSDLFESQIKELLFLGLSALPEVLTDWAWNKVKEYDQYFSEDAKMELITEGCVILQKN